MSIKLDQQVGDELQLLRTKAVMYLTEHCSTMDEICGYITDN
jgi:hypothetical protein